MAAVSVLPPKCGNWSISSTPCSNPGTQTCARCKLVLYCGAACQRVHWPEHKQQCRSKLSQDAWRPAWHSNCRHPPWASGQERANLHNPFGGAKYLWGNTPAIDVLRLDGNEGADYEHDIALLFAASGDMRHVVRTISNLPERLHQQVCIDMNDREFDVVGRNIILVLLALSTQACDIFSRINSIDTVVTAMIHVWYSAFIPQDVSSVLRNTVAPVVDEACREIHGLDAEQIVKKTWKAGKRSIQVVMKQKSWLQLKKMVDNSNGLTLSRAVDVRKAVTLAPMRSDYRDRWFYKEATPFTRLSKRRFQDDGLLLPFGHARLGFDIPNPTFFHHNAWPMDDSADPLSGWSIADIQSVSLPASSDSYGKLYVYLDGLLKRFITRLERNQIRFGLFHFDVRLLGKVLEKEKYSRIEVSNICDSMFVGIHKTISLFAPLLQTNIANPHATIITLFINAVREVAKRDGDRDAGNPTELQRYIPFQPAGNVPWHLDADIYRLWDARFLAMNVDKYFQRYMDHLKFHQICSAFELRIDSNTITERWPTRPTLAYGQQGAVDEFRLALGSRFTNIERYVEWKRPQMLN